MPEVASRHAGLRYDIAMKADGTHGTFEDVLGLCTPGLRPICSALRQQIASMHKSFVEVAWPRQKIASFGVGPKKMSEHYAYIAVQASHVNLGFYHGASLLDPDGLLEGTGKQLRYVKIRDLSLAKGPAVAKLLHLAIAERRQHAGDE